MKQSQDVMPGSQQQEAMRRRLREINVFFRGPMGYVPCDPEMLAKLDAERIELRKKLGLSEAHG